jgi:hypothetical protein
LEEPSVGLNEIESTIWPGLDNNLEPFRQVELGESLLEKWRGEAALHKHIEFAPESLLARSSMQD